jgi:hypothetical protein
MLPFNQRKFFSFVPDRRLGKMGILQTIKANPEKSGGAKLKGLNAYKSKRQPGYRRK